MFRTKLFLLIFFKLISYTVFSQCKDLYGGNSDCPSEQDSLVLYNNALKVFDYYDNNKSYKKTRTRELSTDYDKRNIFEDLTTARRLFFVIRREVTKLKSSEKKFAAGSTSPKYVDITYKEYYQEVDEYRFYQREIESQIVNKEAPIAIYDSRIAPILVNEYHCIDSASQYFGDLVNIPLYIPVTVKPFTLLTQSELEIRNSILLRLDPSYISKQFILPKQDTPKIVKSDIVYVKNKIETDYVSQSEIKKMDFSCSFPIPVYAYNPSTGGTIVGFVCGKYFIKIKPEFYKYYCVPKWAQEILEDEKELKKLLFNKFGGYLEGVK